MLALFLTQAAAGSLIALLLVPPREAGRKFFRYTVAQSCALILLGRALAAAGGAERGPASALFGAGAALLLVSAGLFHLGRLTAGFGLMAAGLAPALGGVTLEALALIPPEDGSTLSRLIYPLDSWTAGLALGAALIAMILGHYYLNVPGLSIGHLQRLAAVLVAAIALRLAVVGASIARSAGALAPLVEALLDARGTPLPDGALDPFVLVFLLLHLLFGVAASGVMAVMAWRTSLIASTQSATGILYVALVMVIMGELASRYLLTLTSLPL